MGCRCGGNGGVSRAVFSSTKSSGSGAAQPILAGQARSRRLTAMIKEQNKYLDQERREIARKREQQILVRMRKVQ